MIDASCPKCNRTGLTPIWHEGGKCNKHNPRTVNPNSREHLHYYCMCQYDFVKIIDKEGEGYDDMGTY